MERAELARLLGGEQNAAGPASRAPVIVREREPVAFMEAFASAAGGVGPVFLADPNWGSVQRAQLSALIQTLPEPSSGVLGKGWLCIPSGGTGGALKFARHDEDTISAAVRGFCAHFSVQKVNAIGVLPLYHVSGLMAWMRCVLTGGDYRQGEWKKIEGGLFPEMDGAADWMISLVPTQLQRLLDSRSARIWLRQFKTVFVGGGAAWSELAEAAAREDLPVSLSYGMTETAAMVAALLPEEFRAGARTCGRLLPHVAATIEADGTVSLVGESLFRGYWPEWRRTREFRTTDCGSIDEHGQLRISGRSDAMIISGGKKISPPEVEEALRATGEFQEVGVIGLPDREWGEVVVACYRPKVAAPNLIKVGQWLSDRLAAHMRPKHFVGIDPWPRNDQGKVSRSELIRLASLELARSAKEVLRD